MDSGVQQAKMKRDAPLLADFAGGGSFEGAESKAARTIKPRRKRWV